VNFEKYETKDSNWREEFEKAYVEWVDLELIEALLNSINCSVRFFCEVINDTTRWPTKINKSLRTVNYSRLRDAADFLGIPPWLLFHHKDKNSKIKELFESINSILKPIELPYFSEYNDFFHNFYDELSTRVRTNKDFEVLSGMLNSFIGQKQYHDVIKGNWRAVISYFNEIHRDFSGGASVFYREPDNIVRGNIRLSFSTHPRNKRILIKSGWLSIKIDSSKANNSTTINMLTSKMISDMECIFDQLPWIFESEIDGMKIYLFTWHSLRTSNAQFESIQSLINRELPNANFSMNITKKQNTLSSFSSRLMTSNPFEEFIRIIQEDVVTQSKPKYKRKKNSLQILFENGKIQNGDRITLLPKANLRAIQIQTIANATIQIVNDKPIVKWDYDNNFYSISKLTYIILIEFGDLAPQTKYHLNGAMFWQLSGTEQSLFCKRQITLCID